MCDNQESIPEVYQELRDLLNNSAYDFRIEFTNCSAHKLTINKLDGKLTVSYQSGDNIEIGGDIFQHEAEEFQVKEDYCSFYQLYMMARTFVEILPGTNTWCNSLLIDIGEPRNFSDCDKITITIIDPLDNNVIYSDDLKMVLFQDYNCACYMIDVQILAFKSDTFILETLRAKTHFGPYPKWCK